MTTAPLHRYTFDTPMTVTVHVTESSEGHARAALAEALNFGVLLDIDAGDGVWFHQAGPVDGQAPLLHAVDDDQVVTTATAGRLVLDCGMVGCAQEASHTVTYTLNRNRVLDFFCPAHVEYYRIERADAGPVFAALDRAAATAVPVERISPWTQVWDLPGVAEWEPVRFRWLVLSTETFRDREGRLRVRWTFQDGRRWDFAYGEVVVGMFAEGRPDYL